MKGCTYSPPPKKIIGFSFDLIIPHPLLYTGRMSALLNLIVVCFSLEMEAQLRTKWHQWKLLRCMVLNSRILSVAQNMSYSVIQSACRLYMLVMLSNLEIINIYFKVIITFSNKNHKVMHPTLNLQYILYFYKQKYLSHNLSLSTTCNHTHYRSLHALR